MHGTQKNTNKIMNIPLGDIVIIQYPDRIVIGCLFSYNHPVVTIEGTSETFPENLVYRGNIERLIMSGMDNDMAIAVMNKEAEMPLYSGIIPN